MKIDTSGWKEFKLIDLFEVCSSKKIFHANTIKNIYDFQQRRNLSLCSSFGY